MTGHPPPLPVGRRPFYTNRVFLGALLLLSALQTTLVLWPERHLVSWFGLAPPRPDDRRLRYSLLVITGTHCLLALLLEVRLDNTQTNAETCKPRGS